MERHGLATYLIGFVLAVVLTAIPSGWWRLMRCRHSASLLVIGIAAVLQVLVHLRFFLHLNFTTTPKENMLAFFTARSSSWWAAASGSCSTCISG